MSDVPMHHPELPGQTIFVDERSVRHHERSGWVAPVTPEPEPDVPADPEPTPAPARKRRTAAERNK